MKLIAVHLVVAFTCAAAIVLLVSGIMLLLRKVKTEEALYEGRSFYGDDYEKYYDYKTRQLPTASLVVAGVAIANSLFASAIAFFIWYTKILYGVNVDQHAEAKARLYETKKEALLKDYKQKDAKMEEKKALIKALSITTKNLSPHHLKKTWQSPKKGNVQTNSKATGNTNTNTTSTTTTTNVKSGSETSTSSSRKRTSKKARKKPKKSESDTTKAKDKRKKRNRNVTTTTTDSYRLPPPDMQHPKRFTSQLKTKLLPGANKGGKRNTDTGTDLDRYPMDPPRRYASQLTTKLFPGARPKGRRGSDTRGFSRRYASKIKPNPRDRLKSVDKDLDLDVYIDPYGIKRQSEPYLRYASQVKSRSEIFSDIHRPDERSHLERKEMLISTAGPPANQKEPVYPMAIDPFGLQIESEPQFRYLSHAKPNQIQKQRENDLRSGSVLSYIHRPDERSHLERKEVLISHPRAPDKNEALYPMNIDPFGVQRHSGPQLHYASQVQPEGTRLQNIDFSSDAPFVGSDGQIVVPINPFGGEIVAEPLRRYTSQEEDTSGQQNLELSGINLIKEESQATTNSTSSLRSYSNNPRLEHQKSLRLTAFASRSGQRPFIHNSTNKADDIHSIGSSANSSFSTVGGRSINAMATMKKESTMVDCDLQQLGTATKFANKPGILQSYRCFTTEETFDVKRQSNLSTEAQSAITDECIDHVERGNILIKVTT